MKHGMRVWGDKSLSPSVTFANAITDELRLTVDGVEYVGYISGGEYEVRHEFFDGPDLINELNQVLADLGAPVTAKLGGIHDDNPRTVIVFEHQDTDPSATLEIDQKCSAFSSLVGRIYHVDTVPDDKPLSNSTNVMASQLTILPQTVRETLIWE